MWYGLTQDGELRAIQWFEKRPSIYDFEMTYDYSSRNDKRNKVVDLDIKIKE